MNPPDNGGPTLILDKMKRQSGCLDSMAKRDIITQSVDPHGNRKIDGPINFSKIKRHRFGTAPQHMKTLANRE
jgi:hypothetical protein